MTNQYTVDRILYVTPPGKPITELRKSGEYLVLYTEDNEVLHRFRHWSQVKRITPYLQGVFFGKNQLVAADLYFPNNKTVRKRLIVALRGHKTRDRQKLGVR